MTSDEEALWPPREPVVVLDVGSLRRRAEDAERKLRELQEAVSTAVEELGSALHKKTIRRGIVLALSKSKEAP